MKTVTTEEILKTAIHFEELSFKFYQRLMETVLDDMTKDALDFLSREELKHREFLVNYLQGKLTAKTIDLSQVHDGKIVEAFQAPAAAPDLLQQDAFLLAAEREKLSHDFYLKLAGIHPEGEVRELLKKLALEELSHKEKVEYLYVNAAFPQTSGG